MVVIEEHPEEDGNEEERTEDYHELKVCRATEGIGSLTVHSTGNSDEENDNDDEDDEDDEAWGGGGLRGVVQKADKEPWKILRQYFPSKAGGTPAWLDPLHLPLGKSMLCGICEKPLQFVLQVYAPAEEDRDAFHRTLFVFMCTSLACLQQDELQQGKEKRLRSVKVFRSQLPRENPFYSSDPPLPDGQECPFSPGALLCSWCGTWKGSKVCGGCKQSRYCSQLHQMDHWRGDHAPYCRQVQEKLKASSDAAVVETPTLAYPKNLWPEFELIVEEAGEEEEEDEELLAEYERRRSGGRGYSAKDVEDVEESSAEEQQWAVFQAKISKSPEQVLWYLRSRDAKPLWPGLAGQTKTSGIPVCSVCGSERTFEFQILPQLLYYFGVQGNPDSLDWGTVAVYSCAQSCKIQGYCEEFAWVRPGFS